MIATGIFKNWSSVPLEKEKIVSFECKMRLVTNGALRAFNFQLHGNVKLNLPDSITHERDRVHAVINDESDDELHL